MYLRSSAILLLLVLLKQNVDCTEDCKPLTECMRNYGATFKHLAVDETNRTSLITFLDGICMKRFVKFVDSQFICVNCKYSNIDALLECYSPQNMIGCSFLKNIVKQVPSQDIMREQITNACTHKEELIAVSECIIKENVTLAIGQCAMKVIEQTSGNDDQPEVKCLIDRDRSRKEEIDSTNKYCRYSVQTTYCLGCGLLLTCIRRFRIMSVMMTCVESSMTGHCPEDAVAFLKSVNQEQHDIYCSASKLGINILLLYVMSMVLRFIIL